MAIRIINLTKTETWAWDKDPDYGTDAETRFEFRPLDAYEQAYLNDRLTTMEGLPTGDNEAEVEASMAGMNTRTEVFKVAIEALRLVTVGITNLQDEDGNVLEFKTEKASVGGRSKKVLHSSLLRGIPPIMAMAAYKKIVEMSTVTKQQEKNSEKV